MKRLVFVVLFCFVAAPFALAQEVPAPYREVLKILDRKGDFKDGVLKVGLPRNDLHLKIAGVDTPTSFGLTGWAGFTRGAGGMDVLMGDLVLTEDEVNPVMSALLENGLEATALHNHFFKETPRMFYMHIHGHGKATELATKLKSALDQIPKTPAPAPASPPARTFDTAKLSSLIGHPGEQLGSVYKITIGRDDLRMKEMGATINARMGLNTWAAFSGTMDDAVIAGDIAMLEAEVNPVLKELRKNGLQVVAIHHHMTGSRPLIIFLHYWGKGSAEKLATSFRAALDQTAHPPKKRPAMGKHM